MAGALANNPQLRGPSEGVFNTMPSLVMLQPDAAPGAAQSNLPEVAVPPSDQMGHLEIVFDEAPNASAPPAAHAAAYRSQSMPQQPVQPLFGSRGSQGADVPAGGSEGGAGRSLQAGAQERSGGSLWPQPSLAARPSMDVHAGGAHTHTHTRTHANSQNHTHGRAASLHSYAHAADVSAYCMQTSFAMVAR